MLYIASTSAGKNQGVLLTGSLGGDKRRVKAVIHHHREFPHWSCFMSRKVVTACSSTINLCNRFLK